MSSRNEDSGRPLLLTGASGFIGAWVLRRAVEAGQPVVACDLAREDLAREDLARDDLAIDRRRFTQIAPDLSRSALITWQALDVTDAEAVSRTVAQHRPRALIHLAALQIPDCARNPRLGALVNILGHLNLLEAAREQGGLPLVYGSSAAAKPRGPAAAPATLYGVYKKTDEEISRLHWQDHGVPSIGLRPYIVYGIGRDQGETSALTLAMRAAALGEAYHIPFRGRFGLQYAADVAEAFLGCARRPFEGALLSDISEGLETMEELVGAIKASVPEAQITVGERERAGPESFDVSTARDLLGGLPHTPLRDGVAATVAAFRQAAQRQEKQPGEAAEAR